MKQSVEEKIKEYHKDDQNYKPIEQLNLTEREQKYLQEKKEKEEQKRKDREDYYNKLLQNFPEPKIEAEKLNQKIQQLEELDREQLNARYNKKDIEEQKLKARQNYSQSLTQKNKEALQLDDKKELEMKIRLDKIQNPRKYIKAVIRHQHEKTENQITDEQIFFNKAPIQIKQDGQSKELGKQYLKSLSVINEEQKRIVRATKSEKQFKKLQIDAEPMFPAISGAQTTCQSHNDLENKKKNQKIQYKNYLKDVRQKYSLDQKVYNWKRYLSEDSDQILLHQNNSSLFNDSKISNFYSDHLEMRKSKKYNNLKNSHMNSEMIQMVRKQKILEEAEKIQAQAKRKEQVLKFKDKKLFSAKDANTLEEVDDLYFESIRAKLAILDDSFSKKQAAATQEKYPQHHHNSNKNYNDSQQLEELLNKSEIIDDEGDKKVQKKQKQDKILTNNSSNYQNDSKIHRSRENSPPVFTNQENVKKEENQNIKKEDNNYNQSSPMPKQKQNLKENGHNFKQNNTSEKQREKSEDSFKKSQIQNSKNQKNKNDISLLSTSPKQNQQVIISPIKKETQEQEELKESKDNSQTFDQQKQYSQIPRPKKKSTNRYDYDMSDQENGDLLIDDTFQQKSQVKSAFQNQQQQHQEQSDIEYKENKLTEEEIKQKEREKEEEELRQLEEEIRLLEEEENRQQQQQQQ